MDSALHRIEALPGSGRYTVTFRGTDGVEQSAVVHLTTEGLDVAPASLPDRWRLGSPSFALLVDAVRAVDSARSADAAPAELRDVDGGWDVMIGNVILGPGGLVTCAAHGAMKLMDEVGGVWACGECGARAAFAER